MRTEQLEHVFVEEIPERLLEGVLYVSLTYATAVHLCCCGCGCEVVTPLSPARWKVTFDGETVSLSPSVGNWDYACGSHYWIDRGSVRWSGRWAPQEVERGRRRDQTDICVRLGPEVYPATRRFAAMWRHVVHWLTAKLTRRRK